MRTVPGLTVKKIARSVSAGLKNIGPSYRRRGIFLCFSVLLAMNIIVTMLPYSPAAVAEDAAPNDAVAISDFASLKAELESHGVSAGSAAPPPVTVNVSLESDIVCAEALYPYTGNTVTIFGNGHKLSRAASFTDGSMLTVDGSTSVTFKNTVLSSKNVRADSPIITIADNASVTLASPSRLLDSHPLSGCGAVYIAGGEFSCDSNVGDYSSITADNAVISGCTDGCEAIYVKSGKVNGCSIYGGHSDKGAVVIENGQVSRLIVKDCANDSASSCGGGVLMLNGELANSVISGCANGSGGGVFMKNGKITDCTITDCTAATAGGGIYAEGGSINNVTVTGCKAGKCGGGIAVFKGVYAEGDEDVSTGSVSLSGSITVTGCGPVTAEDGSVYNAFHGDSVYINGDISTGFASAPVTQAAEVKVPDIFVKSVYSGAYQTNHLADQPDIITYEALSGSSSDKTVAAILSANTSASLEPGARVFGGLFSVDDDTSLKSSLNYQVKLTDGATHATSSSGSGTTSSSGTAESPYKNKKFMYVVYDIDTDESDEKTAAVRHTGKLTADPYGDIVMDMDFIHTATSDDDTLAAVLYEYPDSCRIGDTGYADLEKAIDAAHVGDTITLLRDTEVAKTLDVNKSNLTIDGDGHTVWRSSGFTDRVFHIHPGVNTTFEDLTVTGREYDSRFTEPEDTVPPAVNAPLVSCEGILNLKNSVLRDNDNESSDTDAGSVPGGGVCLNGGKIIGDGNSLITGNTAENGGGVFTVKSAASSTTPLEISGVSVTGNHARVNGGGICADDGIILKDITVQDNTADKQGGGVYAAKNATVGGELQINGNTCGGEPSDYHLLNNTGFMTVNSPLSPSSIIGMKNYKDNSVIAEADGTHVTSLEGLDKCFFADVSSDSSRSVFETDISGAKIYARSGPTAIARYNVTASAGDNGSIAPSDSMKLPAGEHDFYITPDEGYVIDTVTVKPEGSSETQVYKNDAPVSSVSGSSFRIEDGTGILTCDIRRDTDITASFKKADGEFKCETEKTGSDKCSVSAEKAKVGMGESDAVTFSTGKDNLAYALTDIKVNGTSVKTDSSKKKISDYTDSFKINDDDSLGYVYKLNDIRSDKKVTGVFEDVYKKDSRTDSDSKITLSGDYIGRDSQLKVEKLPYTDKSYSAVTKELDAGYKIAKASDKDNDFALYDISLDSETLDLPYRSDVALKLYAGTEYAGATAFAYHVTDVEKGTVDKSLSGKVDSDGYFTVTTDSLSPYAVVIPSAATPTSSTTSSTSATNPTIQQQAAATPSGSPTTASTQVSVSTTSNPNTDGHQPGIFWPLLAGSLAVALISGVTIAVKMRKSSKQEADETTFFE